MPGLFACVRKTLVVFLLIFSSCGSYEEIEFKKVSNFSYRDKANGKTEFVLDVTIDNPNNFKIKVIKGELDLEIGEHKAGKIRLGEKVKIKKNAENEYKVILEASSEEVKAAMVKAAFGSLLKGKVQLKAKGWIKGRVFIFGKKEDVDFKYDINLKDFTN